MATGRRLHAPPRGIARPDKCLPQSVHRPINISRRIKEARATTCPMILRGCVLEPCL